jgi:hypothetical protein
MRISKKARLQGWYCNESGIKEKKGGLSPRVALFHGRYGEDLPYGVN